MRESELFSIPREYSYVDAKAGGHVGGGGGVKTVSKHKMSALEALKILNIEKPDMTLQIVNQVCMCCRVTCNAHHCL